MSTRKENHSIQINFTPTQASNLQTAIISILPTAVHPKSDQPRFRFEDLNDACQYQMLEFLSRLHYELMLIH